jgi:hypothetical protein
LLFVLGVIIFVMVDGSLDWLFTTTPILAHQMPLASAVHHITVNPVSVIPVTVIQWAGWVRFKRLVA